MVGPNIAKVMEPYHFLEPPSGRVEGVIPMRDVEDADLHFDVDGRTFEWWKFRVPRVTGRVDWVGLRLVLTNVSAGFYGGAAKGGAEFLFSEENDGADFRFNLAVSNADLRALMKSMTTNQSRLEGSLTGTLAVNSTNSADWRSLNGGGRASLRDGLIWEIPLFGILSPALDSITPGLGSSRASEASANFIITNGVVRSDDLQVRAPTMRLEYRGTADLQGRVDARAQAELLRDTWVVGPVLSVALWPVTKLFEYKITGTLHDPRTEPVYIPKMFFVPFHPFRTIRDLIPEQPPANLTNAPPAFGTDAGSP
jgi:hypothetical protein